MKKSKSKNHKIRNPQAAICNLKSLIFNFQSSIFNSRGFTLIEIAIVMVVIGLLIGLGANLIGPLIKRAKYTQSRGIVDAAVDSVVAYAAGNEDIPDNGGGTTDFKKIVTSPNDAFTKTLVYFTDSSISVADSRKVCKQKTGDINVYSCNDSTCSTYDTIDNVAFVFVSGGTNMNVQTGSVSTLPDSSSCPSGKTCYVVYEQDTASIDDYTTDTDNPDNYDDIVKWVTLNELRTKAGCTGSLIRILNNELPQGGSPLPNAYSATIYADGGIPFGGGYKWCLTDDSSPDFYTAMGATNPYSCTGTPSCSPITAESNWLTTATDITISGTIALGSEGTYKLTVYVRDDSDNDTGADDDNCAQKTFVIAVNP